MHTLQLYWYFYQTISVIKPRWTTNEIFEVKWLTCTLNAYFPICVHIVLANSLERHREIGIEVTFNLLLSFLSFQSTCRSTWFTLLWSGRQNLLNMCNWSCMFNSLVFFKKKTAFSLKRCKCVLLISKP